MHARREHAGNMNDADFSQAYPDAEGQLEFHVSYYDDRCMQPATELFDNEIAANRFAARMVQDEHEWAVVDKVYVKRSRRAA
jgi:hypothetical protein